MDMGKDKENPPSISEPVATAPPAQTDAGTNQSPESLPVPAVEEPSAPAEVTNSVTQPSTGPAPPTIFTDFDEAEAEDEEPPYTRKRKRNSVNVNYLADVESPVEANEAPIEKPGWTMKGTQGPTWKGHEVKHGVPIGVWTLSDEPVDERKHVIYGFLDPKLALHGRKYPERKDGSKYTGNFPSGTGTWAAKADEWLLDAHLKGLNRKELTEYVRVRQNTWKVDETPEERADRDKSAVAEAKLAAAASEFTVRTEPKGSARKSAKSYTPRRSNVARDSFGEPSPSNNSTPGTAGRTDTPSDNRRTRALLTSNDGTPSAKAPKDLKMGSPPLTSTPRGRPRGSGAASRPSTPAKESKYVIKGRDVLIGYWKDSSEPDLINKHAMYGVIQAHGVFRVKVVPETRDGRYTEGNYPALHGGCWVNYDTCVFEKYLKDLVRTEVEEYCRICTSDPDYNDGIQGPVIDRAVQEAKRIVAIKAAAEGLDIVEYNRKRCDQLEKGAIARELEKQRKRGQVPEKPAKAEVKPTGIKSDKATSDARALKVRQARKEAKEASEREAAELKAQESPRAQRERGRSSNASQAAAGASNGTGSETSWSKHVKDLTSAYDHLKHGSPTPTSEKNSINGHESDSTKFYLLDREAQRAKMERWCRLKTTSKYHTMDREGQKRHVEKHIDQLIEKQTGKAANRPKKRSRTGDYQSASPAPAHPGAVTAPSPLATSVTQTVSPKAGTPGPSYRTESLRQAPITPAASEVAGVPTSSELAAAPLPRSVDNKADVHMVDAPVEHTTTPAPPTTRSSAAMEKAHNEPITTTTQSKAMGNATDATPASASAPALGANSQEAAKTSSNEDVVMSDAIVEIATAAAQPLTSHLTPPAEYSALPRATIEKALPLLQSQQQQALNTPQSLRTSSEKSPALTASAPTTPYISPYSQPTAATIAAAAVVEAPPNPPQAQLQHTQSRDATPARGPALATQQFAAAATPPSSARPAPQIIEGDDDGLKYRLHPRGRFSGLFVSLDRNIVEIEGAEYVQQFVLVPMSGSGGGKLELGGEIKVDNYGVEVRVAMNGLFEGYLVGVKRMVTAVDCEDFKKFVVSVPA
jgi:hypothetical protein